MEGVRCYGITCHCYRFQGIFDNANGIILIEGYGIFIDLKLPCEYSALIQ